MKTLSQIPRNVSAKFCYDIDQLGQSENIESTDFVPYTFEDSSDTQDNSPKLTEEEEEQNKIDAQELAKIEVKLNLEDSTLVNDKVASNDLRSEISTKLVDQSLFRKFFSSNLNDEMKNVSNELADLDPKNNKNMASLMGSMNVEDFDIELDA